MARMVYQGLGLVMVAVGAIGVFVPLLPTTPFLLLAMACFARSSPDWNKRLLRIPLLGERSAIGKPGGACGPRPRRKPSG